jgi:hypothetical protein
MFFGWLILFVLIALAALAAVGIAVRAAPEGRAELGILATLVFFALLVTPVYLLGYTGHLTATLLAILSAPLFGAAFLASAWRRGVRRHFEDTLHHAGTILGMVPDGLRQAMRARSVVLVGLVWTVGVIGVSAWIMYLAPSESWDGLFYHEPMVGLAIQNHGFSVVSLPPIEAVQAVNGYPRLCESVALWFVIFTDKTFIEIGNTLAAPALMWTIYAIARRFGDRVIAMGWAAVTLLMPAMWTQLSTSMIDVEVALFLLAALYFCTRPRYRVRDAVCSTLAMLLVTGSKSTALVWVPPLAAVAYSRLLLYHWRDRRWASVAVIGGGATLMVGLAALTFVRNWIVFKNPLWPITYEIPKLGIHWAGLQTLADMVPNPPLADLASVKYGLPTGGVGDVIRRDYGYAIPWVIIPLGGLALVIALLASIRDLVCQQRGRAVDLIVLSFPALVALRFSPSLSIGRFNVHIVASFMFAVSWLAGQKRWLRWGEGAVAASIVLSIMPFFWMQSWYWGTNPAGVADLLKHSHEQRASMNTASFEMPAAVARLRELELGRGDRVAYTQELAFSGVLWNFQFSNRVEYIPFTRADEFLEKLAQLHPKWVAVGGSSPGRAALATRPRDWELVGEAAHVGTTVIYRHR